MPALNELAGLAYDADRTYADVVHMVHLYVIEPHPQAPDVSPYRGRVWEKEYSDYRQPLVYEDRLANAAATVPLLAPGQLLLVDDLDEDGRINPVWCTYGPAPHAAFLVRRDGVVDTMQTWAQVDALRTAIDDLLADD